MNEENLKVIIGDLHKRIFALEQEINPIKRLYSHADLTRAFIHGKNNLSEREFINWKKTLRK